MQRFIVALTFVLAAYAALMSTPGVIAQGRQLFFPRGTEAAPGLAIEGERRTGLYLDENSDLSVALRGTKIATFDQTGLGFGAPAGVSTSSANTWTALQSFDVASGSEIDFPGSSTTIDAQNGPLIFDVSHPSSSNFEVQLDTGASSQFRVEAGAGTLFRCQGDPTSEAGCHFEQAHSSFQALVEVDEVAATILTGGNEYYGYRYVPTVANHTGGTLFAFKFEQASADVDLADYAIDIEQNYSAGIRNANKTVMLPQAATCPDSGDGSPGVLTLTATRGYIEITNSDVHGCTLTVGEGSALEGESFTAVVVSTAGGAVNFADTAGVTEISGAFAAGLHDTITLYYNGTAYVEVSRSDN
jgi:hypothetical protein